MNTSERLYSRFALITSAEKLTDRFLYTGSIPLEPSESGPTLLFSLEVTRPWFPSSRLFPTITNTLSARYGFIKRSNNPLKSFEAALKTVNEELLAIAEQGETDWIGHLNGLLALIINDEVHIAQTGSSTAYLFRQRRISQITDESTDQSEPHPLTTFANIVSGQVNEGDRLVFANQDLFALVSLDQVRTAVTDQTPWAAANQIARHIRRSRLISVSAIIWGLEKRAVWQEAGQEPFSVNLEESLQTWPKRAWKALRPYWLRAGEVGRQTWRATRATTARARVNWQSTYRPRARAWLNQSGEAIGRVSHSAARQLTGSSQPLTSAEKWVERQLRPGRARLGILSRRLRTADAAVGHATNGLRRRLAPLTRGRYARYLLALVAIILLVVTTISIQRRQQSQQLVSALNQNEAVLASVTDLADRLDTAIQLKQQNEAQNLLVSALGQLANLNSPSAEQAAAAASLRSRLQQRGDVLTGTTRLSANTTLEAPADSRHLVATDKGLAVFTTGRAARFFVKQLANSQQDFTVEAPVIDGRFSAEKDEIVVLSNDRRMGSVRRSNDEMIVAAKSVPDGAVADGQHLDMFLGNLYLLDGNNGLLWKYPAEGDNFGGGISQVQPAEVAVVGARDLAIDGFVYILQADGGVVKLLRGRPVGGFALSGIPSINQPDQFVKLATGEATDRLYLLEQGSDDREPRLLVFTKDGLYERQYAFVEPVGEITDWSVDLINRTFWLLAGGQIYEYRL